MPNFALCKLTLKNEVLKMAYNVEVVRFMANATEIENRVILEAKYIITKKCTVREAAKIFQVSKSTIHRDVTFKLPRTNIKLAKQVMAILLFNLSQRSIRGGRAFRQKRADFKRADKRRDTLRTNVPRVTSSL